MGYLVLLSLAVFLLGLVPSRVGLRQNNYKNYLIFAGLLVTLVTGLRSPYVGSPDTYRYVLNFEALTKYSSFLEYYNRGLAERSFLVSETGYYFAVWLLTRVFSDRQILVFVTMAFCTFSVCRFIQKNSEDAPTSLLIYVCLGLMTFNMNGVRQACAMSICLFAYEYAKKGKLIPFAILVLLAMQFHKTALCFVPVFVLPRLQDRKGDVVFFLFGLVFFLLSMDWFVTTFSDLVDKEYATDAIADGGGISVLLIYAVGLLLPVFAKGFLKDKTIRISYYAGFTAFACYLARYFSNQMLERVSYYYLYFLIILIPNTIKKMNKKEQQFVIGVFSVAAIALFAYRCRNGSFRYFRFFFQ